jgi:Ran GTPase-activating protein (RanGAP) involved in mRNA processing and transport
LQFLAANFQKCDRKQLDLKECVLKAAQNGIPQLTRAYDEVNIPNVHPLEVAEATIGAGTGSVAVEQKLKQCKLDGFHEMKVDKFE